MFPRRIVRARKAATFAKSYVDYGGGSLEGAARQLSTKHSSHRNALARSLKLERAHKARVVVKRSKR